MFPLVDCATDHAERGAPDTSGRQRPGVAVGQHGRVIFDQLSTELRDQTLRLDIFVMNRFRIVDQHLLDLGDRLPFRLCTLECPLHSVDRPEQIHCRRPCFADHVADIIELVLKIVDVGAYELLRSKCDAVRRRNSDRRSPAYDHILDTGSDIVISSEQQPLLFGWQ